MSVMNVIYLRLCMFSKIYCSTLKKWKCWEIIYMFYSAGKNLHSINFKKQVWMGLAKTAIDKFVLNTSSRFCCLLQKASAPEISSKESFQWTYKLGEICEKESQACFYRSYENAVLKGSPSFASCPLYTLYHYSACDKKDSYV